MNNKGLLSSVQINFYERSFLLRNAIKSAGADMVGVAGVSLPGELFIVERHGGIFWFEPQCRGNAPLFSMALSAEKDETLPPPLECVCSWPLSKQSWFKKMQDARPSRKVDGWQCAVWGMSLDSLIELLTACNRTEIECGDKDERVPLMKIEVSRTTVLTCELTGMLIPTGSPYITWANRWSAVSLYGFYRYLAIRLRNPQSAYAQHMSRHLSQNVKLLQLVHQLSVKSAGVLVARNLPTMSYTSELSRSPEVSP